MHADKWHRKVVRELIKELSNDSKEKQNEILEAITSSLKVLNNFLTGMEKGYC